VSPIFKEGKKDTKPSIFDTHDDQLRSIATALSTTDSAFAGKKKYEKSQALSQANACGNGVLPLNVFCQNLISQIQGDGNAVTIMTYYCSIAANNYTRTSNKGQLLI
jgi:hypothetical protein